MSAEQSTVTFKDVPGWPGYRVGDDGTVWSQYHPHPGRGTVRKDQWRRLVGGTDKDGYKKVILCIGGVRRYVRVNVLVLEVFVGPCPPGMLSAHDNGVRSDNRLTNLAWKTQQENVADKKRHGTHQAGEKHAMSKLTDEQVREIRRRRAAGETGISLAREFGVWNGTISDVVTGRRWSHVT